MNLFLHLEVAVDTSSWRHSDVIGPEMGFPFGSPPQAWPAEALESAKLLGPPFFKQGLAEALEPAKAWILRGAN